MTGSVLSLRVTAAKRFYGRDGYEVQFDDPTWVLSKDVSVPVSNAAEYLSESLHQSYLEVLAFYAKGNSPHYVWVLHREFLYYLRFAGRAKQFSVESLISYHAFLGKKGEPRLASLRTFLRKWYSLGYGGVPSEAIRLFERWKLSGGERGNPVRSMCPERGPLTDIEMDAVLTAAIEAYEGGQLSLSDIAIAMTVMMTGRRPIQITALKICDLRHQSEKYFLYVPRAKQRKNGGWRKSFKQVPIVEDLWLLLQQQAEAVYREFKRLAHITPDLRGRLPLFAEHEALEDLGDVAALLDSDKLHMKTEKLARTMDHVAEIIAVISERTGAPIHMNPYRFRYTLGTNLGREGKGEYVIAEALDHTDTQHTGAYVKNLPEIVERIDKAVAYQLAPIAQAFQGVIVKTEGEAQRGADPGSRVSNGTQNLGSCGSYGFCGALAPIACYTCNHFQPWLDGPHESVLDNLLQERDRIRDLTGDLKVASVNDRLILAVSDVILRCQDLKEGIARG